MLIPNGADFILWKLLIQTKNTQHLWGFTKEDQSINTGFEAWAFQHHGIFCSTSWPLTPRCTSVWRDLSGWGPASTQTPPNAKENSSQQWYPWSSKKSFFSFTARPCGKRSRAWWVHPTNPLNQCFDPSPFSSRPVHCGAHQHLPLSNWQVCSSGSSACAPSQPFWAGCWPASEASQYSSDDNSLFSDWKSDINKSNMIITVQPSGWLTPHQNR